MVAGDGDGQRLEVFQDAEQDVGCFGCGLPFVDIAVEDHEGRRDRHGVDLPDEVAEIPVVRVGRFTPRPFPAHMRVGVDYECELLCVPFELRKPRAFGATGSIPSP